MPRNRNLFPDFRDKKDGLKKLATNFTKVVGTVAVNHFKGNFQKQGFLDNALERWKPRKNAKNPKNVGRKILTQSGDLMRSIKVINRTRNSVTIGTDVIYAEIHNNGGDINHPGGTAYAKSKKKEHLMVFISNKKAAKLTDVKRTQAHTIPIPKRQFIGHSGILDKRIKAWLKSQVMALLK